MPTAMRRPANIAAQPMLPVEPTLSLQSLQVKSPLTACPFLASTQSLSTLHSYYTLGRTYRVKLNLNVKVLDFLSRLVARRPPRPAPPSRAPHSARRGRESAPSWSVAWADLSVEFVEGRELPNPFSLTLPTSTSSGVTFPFGSLRDCGAFLRALMERFGVESRGHLIALLGMPHHTSACDHVRHWTHGQWAIGPQYLVRVLVLVLWAVDPWRFASLSDLCAVDWPGRSVKWAKRRQHEWESDGNYGTPPRPCEVL